MVDRVEQTTLQAVLVHLRLQLACSYLRARHLQDLSPPWHEDTRFVVLPGCMHSAMTQPSDLAFAAQVHIPAQKTTNSRCSAGFAKRIRIFTSKTAEGAHRPLRHFRDCGERHRNGCTATSGPANGTNGDCQNWRSDSCRGRLRRTSLYPNYGWRHVAASPFTALVGVDGIMDCAGSTTINGDCRRVISRQQHTLELAQHITDPVKPSPRLVKSDAKLRRTASVAALRPQHVARGTSVTHQRGAQRLHAQNPEFAVHLRNIVHCLVAPVSLDESCDSDCSSMAGTGLDVSSVEQSHASSVADCGAWVTGKRRYCSLEVDCDDASSAYAASTPLLVDQAQGNCTDEGCATSRLAGCSSHLSSINERILIGRQRIAEADRGLKTLPEFVREYLGT